jgi:flagellar protein FliS
MASMYRGVSATTAVEGASPHKLVSMLYQAAYGEIAAARGAIARGDVAEKCRAIGHAVRIVEEGLAAPLDRQAGGALAANLGDLYDYIVRRLTIANLKSDDAVLADCASLVQTMRDSWDAIAPQVEAPAQAAA